MTTILAIQGSPRGKKGNTDIMLQEFLKGASGAGAETETIYLKELTINHCTGCFSCWTKTPGVCIFKDDMPPLLEKIRECDILVFATPLYYYTMTSLLKTFQDRMLPLVDPHFVRYGDTYRHPSRYEKKHKIVLISNCGFPDISQFDALRHTIRMKGKYGGASLAGELLMPSGELLGRNELKKLTEDHLAACFKAGAEIVQDGKISNETEAAVQKLVFSPDDIADMVNIIWDHAISTEKSYTADGKKSIKLMLRGMAATYCPDAAPDLQAVIQFIITGEDQGNWYLSIHNGACEFNEGVSDQTTLTINTPSDVWLAISQKELDGKQALIDGKYSVQGDTNLLLMLQDLFSN